MMAFETTTKTATVMMLRLTNFSCIGEQSQHCLPIESQKLKHHWPCHTLVKLLPVLQAQSLSFFTVKIWFITTIQTVKLRNYAALPTHLDLDGLSLQCRSTTQRCLWPCCCLINQAPGLFHQAPRPRMVMLLMVTGIKIAGPGSHVGLLAIQGPTELVSQCRSMM